MKLRDQHAVSANLQVKHIGHSHAQGLQQQRLVQSFLTQQSTCHCDCHQLTPHTGSYSGLYVPHPEEKHVANEMKGCQGVSVCAYMVASAVGQRLVTLETLLVYGGAQPGEVAV